MNFPQTRQVSEDLPGLRIVPEPDRRRKENRAAGDRAALSGEGLCAGCAEQ
jgi:hypothetical protein